MDAEWIRVVGAREHNLANIDVDIPKRRLTVVTGVSGSGKSSLVFDTIAAEAQRQLNETLPAFVRGFLPSYGHPDVDMIEHLAAVIMVDQRRLGGGSRSTVGTITDIAPLLRLLFSRAGTPYVGYSDAFSFNMPAGMCPGCEGLGEITDIDMNAFLDPSRSLNEGALLAPAFKVGTWNWQIYGGSGRFDPDKPVRDYTGQERHTLLHSTSGSVPLDAQGQQINASYEGAAVKFRRLYIQRDTAEMGERTRRMAARFITSAPCPECGGARLSRAALDCRVCGYGIAELLRMEASRLLDVLATFDLADVVPIVDSLAKRIGHLVDIGLGYLSLDRRTDTLSGVAGSGKSTLVYGVFCAQHPDTVVVDQSAPTANRRSTTATYTGALDPIRKALAKANGVSPALFSANSAGACETCEGTGVIYTDLAFLDGITSTCETCHGRRFTEDVLTYHLSGATISDVLEMTAGEALEFFAGHRSVAPILRAVVDVGLDYLRLGQRSTVTGISAANEQANTMAAVTSPAPRSSRRAATRRPAINRAATTKLPALR